ncbi:MULTISPECIES: sigma-70 family RNA polymerase sigma factor [Anoxybacillus]|uniref:Sigma-70 family RNA polymerase sigma factor n=1 Tax=Anoxybacillus flavithermus TaxID=33934 RepID=A0AAX1ZZP5_9BACL|nr:sigma-70 family RNA polymerase sigma factor [Anoxybacillus flavithermus]ELK23092.1 RNA polymerase sigma factor, sigma-70 family [Anoxybacillus flavithermus TNO-09.006]MBE2913744.1 sigma-70 family RNA polymerase sigma factor [Anoxybacillus flavithermus]MBE2927212.1 sigma-70 family RNA polymerase sigma factor [Anoxybacillus flavithermus]MBE2938014.1 sigma-70 family RNA polymerase sigma factor [Anoxybacillus flavithermus]MBE2945777.1 sigma-70 family RNA polymerase sigma factor [Anoxybacillus f
MLSKEVNNSEIRCEVERLKERLPIILENPIIKEFLKDSDHREVFYKTLEDPSVNNVQMLDEKFKKFYRYNRIIRYLMGFIRRYPIDYDKKVKLRSSRYQLIIDKPINNGRDDSRVSMREMIVDKRELPLDFLLTKEYERQGIFYIKNEVLSNALQSLNPNQRKILYLYYERGFNNKEIARILGQTEQNISYWHKKTLKQLREKLIH